MITRSASENENPRTVPYKQRPVINGILDFAIKTHKYYYNRDCKRCYENYDVNPEGGHAFITSLSFKINKFGWGNDTYGILDIQSDQFDPNGNEIHKLLLEHDREFDLFSLSYFVSTYISLDSRTAQDDVILYNIFSPMNHDKKYCES